MPKVQINRPCVLKLHATDASPDTLPNEDGTYDVTDPVVYVCWRNDPGGGGHVQLKVEAEARMLRDSADSAHAANMSQATVWLPALDRHEINTFIRALRDARDKALGADA